MKQIERFVAVAPKLKGDGSLEYYLWTDDDGAL